MLTKKIVLSDVPDLVDIMEKSFFQRDGFEMVRVIESDEAFQCIETDSPALAILDLSSLGAEGIHCCRRLKSDPLLQVTPIILILAENQLGLKSRCWDAGSDQVLERPLSALQLLDDACNLLGISLRLARRFPVSFHLEFRRDNDKKHVGIAVNLNIGGMFLASEVLYPQDASIILEFTLPGYTMPIGCLARVAWINHPEWVNKNNLPSGMGVEFLDLSGTAEIVLQNFLDQLMKIN
ncbi:MAG TPA: response regulator [Tichowtungia sp.]|nr:response regulator [Tichowtungia sp.]